MLNKTTSKIRKYKKKASSAVTVNRLVKTNFITVCLHQKNDPVTFCFHPGLWNPLRAQQPSISDSHMLPIREPLRGPRQIPPIAPTPPAPTGFPSFPCCTSELACRPSPLLLPPPPSPLHREGIYILIGRAAKWGYVLRQAAGNAPSCTSFQWTLQTIPGLVKMIFLGLTLCSSANICIIHTCIFYRTTKISEMRFHVSPARIWGDKVGLQGLRLTFRCSPLPS